MFSVCSTIADVCRARAEVHEMAVHGDRMAGGFILITGIDGTRYAVRQHAVAVIHDADECHDETLVQLYGGLVVRVRSPQRTLACRPA